jgi:thiamine-phosphate pyrophosphorylase
LKLRGLYAITPDTADTEALARKVEQALAGGAAALQYRNKVLSRDKRLAQAKRLAELARGYGVPFIVNDDVEVAVAVGANGAHLGKDDAALGPTRERLAGKVLGVSCYDRPELARAAVAAGGRCARRSRSSRRRSRSACPSPRSAASPSTTRRRSSRRAPTSSR